MTRFPDRWGATEDEVARGFPADALVAHPARRLTRAIDVVAPSDLTYRWLCQLRCAPYSYDLLDNGGRRSPTELTDSGTIETGERLMRLFTVVAVTDRREFTARIRSSRYLTPTALTYAVAPSGERTSRIVVRMTIRQRTVLDRISGWPLALADGIMMRKQLLTIRRYAERDAHRAACD